MNDLSPWRIRRVVQPQDIQPEYTHVSPSDDVHLGEYWKILVKRRRIITNVLLLIFAFGVYFAFSSTKLYTASTTLKIEPQNPQVTGVAALEPLVGGVDYDYHQTQFALLKSRRLMAKVIADFRLESNKVFTDSRVISSNPLQRLNSWFSGVEGNFSYFLAPLFQADSPSEGSASRKALTELNKLEFELNINPRHVNRYESFLNIDPVRKTRLVKVKFTTPHPSLSQDLANAHAQAFIRTSFESRFSLTKEARDFLDQKVKELKVKLEKSEAVATDFRRKHGVVSVERGENVVLDRLVELNRQLTTARAQRIESEALYRTVENKNHQDLAEVMKQGLVQQHKGSVANLEAEKARLSTIFKPDHPRIQELTQQIALARQALNNEIANVVKGVKSGYAAALAKERGLQAEADKQQQEALKTKELGVDYTVLQQEVNANRSLYENLLKRLNETSVSNDISISNLQIVEAAEKPSRASSPNTPLYLLISLILGAFLGVGIAFAQEYFDSTVSTAEDVWHSLGLSTLGVVPHFKSLGERAVHNADKTDRSSPGPEHSRLLTHNNAPAKELIISHSPISIISESYRTIRTSLLFSQAEKPPQIILLTSAAPGEGKTTTTLNLSIALAREGHSVLVVDADMRKGLCHSRLGLRNNRGLSNVLTGRLSLEEGIQATSVNGLSFLSRGTIPPNPTELLGSTKMKEILEKLRQTFNFIFIDSPPVVVVSDAAVISVLSDGVLLVIDGQKTSRPSAQKAVERLDVVHARLLGVILNGVNLDDPNYSYYRSYASYYDVKPDENDKYEANDKEPNQAVHRHNNLSKMAHVWSTKERLQAKDPLKPEAPDRMKSSEPAMSNPQCAPGVESAGEKIVEAIVSEQESTGRKIVEKPSWEDSSLARIPQESLNRLTEALTKAVGPVAPLIVRAQIDTLGESQVAFPEGRISELLKSIQSEITHDELKLFQANLPEEFRNPNNH